MYPRFFQLIVASFLLLGICTSALQAQKTNFVIILADDLGYGDTQPFNPESKIETPSFNRLASQSMLFVDAHSGSGVCTPTRYGLVCGRYAWRTRLKRGVLGGYSKPLIDAEQQTFAGQLQAAGYHTHAIGKWHLGLGWQWKDKSPDNINNFGIAGKQGDVDYAKPITDGPLEHGFTSCYLFPASLDMSPYVFIKDRNVEAVPDQLIDGKPFPHFYRKGEAPEGFAVEDVLGILTRQAQNYIREQSKTEQPFCLYFPLTAPHKPVAPSKDFVGRTKQGLYGDFITEVDWAVGQVMETLAETGMENNTVLIVTSDNGSFMHTRTDDSPDHITKPGVQAFQAKNHKANGNLRGTKADVFEAGHRVPFYVRWPGGMPAELQGTKNNTTICHTDILSTICAIAGAEYDATKSPDSFDYSAILAGRTDGIERPPVINHSSNGMFAIRNGHWKLILGNGSGGRAQPRGKPFAKPYQLYNLSDDLAETRNLVEGNADAVAKMESEFEKIAAGDHETQKD